MVEKIVLSPGRLRRIGGSFAFIEHRFLLHGFFDALAHHELLLYLFLVLAGDRSGLSFYCYDRICAHLRISVDDYIEERNALIQKDLGRAWGTGIDILIGMIKFACKRF